MKAVSGTLMRSIEASAIQLGQVDSWSMMKRAGEALAREAAQFRGRGVFFAVLATVLALRVRSGAWCRRHLSA